MKGFKSTSTNPYTYIQSGVWKKGQYTFQAVVLSDSGYAFAFQRSDTTWQTVDLSWQVKDGSYSKIQWTFALEVDAVAFKLIANTVTGETTVLQPMLEKGTNGSTPIAHEEDLRGMDGDNHEFIFTRNDTGIAPETPLSTQDDDYVPEDWTDNAQGVTPEIPFEFVSMRERKNGVWLDFSPPSLWAKWGEDGLSVNLLVEGHYNSHWEGITKVVDIVGGVDVGGNEVVKVSAVFRKGEENIAATVSQSRGFRWYVNGIHLTSFDNQPFITLDETYGDGFADYVVLSYLVNSIREEERREIINISEGMDGIGEEFIFKANNSDTTPPVLPQTTDVGYQDDDYYGQGTANEWNDDPVAPTELNQFVWVAKRKKIGGIWEAFGTPSIWTWWVTDGDDVAYWELHSTSPVIYKDAEDASTSGVHTTITLSGRYVKGVSSQNGGYISVQPNGGVEDTPLISPREFTPPNNAGVDEYVIRLYDDDSKATLLDTLTVPIAFKGEKGVSAINIILSNESDALPASPEGVVSDYSGSGTTIRVFEGNQELSYGTGNGKYQVSATGSNISPDSTPTTNGNARVYGNASSMGAAATAVITFVVSGKTFGGESFSFDKVQNFTKSERGDEGEDGEDGITIIPNQQGYTYRADLNGDIIGSLANGMVELTITSGSTPITCPSISGGTPTANGTYRVTRTLGNGITTNQSLSDGKYRITPATLTVDEASVNLDIKIMMGGVVTSYPLILTYRKQFDGADGKSTEFIFKGHTSDNTAPTLPSTSQQDDWYGQGTANEWNDDLIEPTKSLPYVWASQRKKVDGVWGAFTTPKVWLRYAEDAKTLTLSASSIVMACTSDNQPKAGQTINVNVKLQNVTGTATIAATPYNDAGIAQARITLGGSGNTDRTLTDAQWLATYNKVVITATLGGLSDTVTITRLADATDGYSVGLTKGEHTYSYDKDGAIKGSLSDGAVSVDVYNGAKMLTCNSTGTGLPIVDDTYRVTAIALSPLSKLTYNVAISSNNYKLTPTGITADEVEVIFTIVARTKGINTFFNRTVRYKKTQDGADGDGITSTTIHYAKSDNGTTPPDNGWITSVPEATQGWYLWTRTTTTYKFAETTVSYSVSHWAEDGADGADGEPSKSLILSASSLTMACYSTNVAKTGQTITIKAKLQNVTGNASFDATPYNASGTALTKITLGGSGNTRTLTNAQWLSTFQKVVITATLSGLSDSVTIARLPDGGDGDDGDPAKSIHLNPSTKAISITKGNIPVPSSVTVTGTAVNTTIQYWYYSVNGDSSFTSSPPTGVSRSSNVVTINSSTARFKTLSIKARNSTDDVEDVVTITRGGGAPYVDETTNTWWAWNEELGIYTDTGMSPVGSDGRIPYPAGYWEAKTYTRDADYAPYVQHTMAVYLLVADSALSTDVPGTSNKWKAFNNWQAVFIDSLVASFAKIGGAVFTGNTDPSSTIRGRLISETGVKSGADNTNYSEYVGDSGAWIPKLMLNFLTGAAYFGAKKIMFNPDGSGQLASGNISWDDDGNVVMSGIEATNAIFSGLVKVPFMDGNYAQSTPPNGLRNYTFTNNNDLTVWYLPEDNALNGARIMFINWRTTVKTLRLSNGRFFGQWYSGDTKRYDIPANSFCEMTGFSLGTTFQGWLVTNSGTII